MSAMMMHRDQVSDIFIRRINCRFIIININKKVNIKL